MSKEDYDILVARINDIAGKHCKNYPGIESVGSLEKLYAIESTLLGTGDACKDLHEVIEKFRVKCGMSFEELVDMVD